MKKWKYRFLCAVMVGATAGCNSQSEKPQEKVFIDEAELRNLYTNPEEYRNQYVSLTGQVFSTPEIDGNLVVFQMFQDPESSDRNTVIGCEKEICENVQANDFIKLTGYVKGTYEGENMMGAKLIAPKIVAEELEISTYMDVVAPATATIDVNQTLQQQDIAMTISKIELSDLETRVYLSIDNQSSDTFTFYPFNTKITQGNNQYEETPNYAAHYPEISSEILPGIVSEGILVFPKLAASPFKVHCKGRSSDYQIEFDDFIFEISM